MSNINPKIWGQPGWIFLHSITFSYSQNPTPNDKIIMKDFFTNLQFILPCLSCKNNYARHIQIYPLNDEVLSNRKNLVDWLITIRNISNKEIGKPEITLKDVIEQLESHQMSSSSHKKNSKSKFITEKRL